MPDLSVVVLSYNTRELLHGCLDSIFANQAGYQVEVILVDNASSDGSPEMVQERYPQVRLIANQENLGFARGNNQGVRAAAAPTILLLNSDAMLTPGALPALLSLAQAQPKAGIVGARLLNPDGSFQASHTPIPTLWQEFLILSGLGKLLFGQRYPSRGPELEKGPQVVGYVEGACLLAPREAYLQAGGLDEGYFMYAEDVDLCFAMRRRGYQVWYQPEAGVIHIGGASSRTRRPEREADLYRSRVRLFRKYYGDLPAVLLKALIFFFTAVKVLYHGLARSLSHGRFGRPVVPLSYLAMKLKDV